MQAQIIREKQLVEMINKNVNGKTVLILSNSADLARFALRGGVWQRRSVPRKLTFCLETPLPLE